ncbi:MAG: hypothetical protein WAL56_09705 [Candidatus Sulfotelmatobacter sp.]
MYNLGMGSASQLVKRWWALMSCALFTVLGTYAAYAGKDGVWVVKATFALAGVCFVIAILQEWWRERGKRLELEAVQFAAKLQIQGRYTSPSLDRLKRGIDHILLLADIELVEPESAEVSYSLDLVKQGITYTAEWAQDVEEWQVFDKGENRGKAFPLPVHIVRGKKVDGWLHFRVDGIGEAELRECRVRLWANTQRGPAYCEYPGNAWPMPRRDLTMKRKRTLDPTAKAFHQLLDKAATEPRSWGAVIVRSD